MSARPASRSDSIASDFSVEIPRCSANARSTMLISKTINDAINEQIGNEFNASLQYISIAAHFEGETLPMLAQHFYKQAGEEVLGQHRQRLPIEMRREDRKSIRLNSSH